MSIHHGYSHAFAITPSDTVPIGSPCEAIYVGGTGDVEVLMASGSTVLFEAVPAGTTLPVKPKRVNATATDATNLVGLWGQ